MENSEIMDNSEAFEIFHDKSFYDMFCVRLSADRDFYSKTLFHFNLETDAQEFLRLLKTCENPVKLAKLIGEAR